MISVIPIIAGNPDATDEFPLHALGNDIIKLRERNAQPLNTLPGNDYPRRRIAYLFRQRAPIDQMADLDDSSSSHNAGSSSSNAVPYQSLRSTE